EEHARVRRQRLDVSPLSLGKERVERQRGFAGAGHASDHCQSIVGNLERDVAQVVLAGSFDAEPKGPRHPISPPEPDILAKVRSPRILLSLARNGGETVGKSRRSRT